jgi:hypothetical protein
LSFTSGSGDGCEVVDLSAFFTIKLQLAAFACLMAASQQLERRLTSFHFNGVSAYLEDRLARIDFRLS